MSVKNIIPINSFKYWFYPSGIRRYTWRVIEFETESHIADIWEDDPDPVICEEGEESCKDDIRSDFEKFKYRPEYYLCGVDIPKGISIVDMYDMLLAGSVLMQNLNISNREVSESKILDRIDRCLKWLHDTDFYTAPASTIYHDSEPYGLVKHSLEVANEIKQLWYLPKFCDIDISQAILVALVHDWCKIGRYEPYLKNVKNENTGVWEKVESYRYKDSPLPFGHGEASVFIANKLLHLTTEQSLAIRWHMGWSRVYQQDMNDLQYSNENYPLVHMLQFADQLSIVNY